MTSPPDSDYPPVPGPETQTSASPAAPGDSPPPTRKRWIVAAMGAVALALFAVPLLQGPEDDQHDAPADEAMTAEGGTCSPNGGTANLDFTLTDMHGAQVRLADYKGKVILLNFWATWCGPCKVEIPDFVEVYAEYRDRGLEILGVLNLDDPSPDELRAFAAQYKMNYPVLRGTDEFEAAHGPIYGLPTTFLIDRQGGICAKHMGPVNKEIVEREIQGLL